LAFHSDGAIAWVTPIEVPGCYVSDPEGATTIVVEGGIARIGVGPYQALVAAADGRLDLAACGRLLVSPSGDVALMAASGSEPNPPTNYTDGQGVRHRVEDLRTATDAMALVADGREMLAVIDAENSMVLMDPATGEDVWRRPESLSAQSAFEGSDATRIYVGSVNGLKAVNLTDGTVAWTWRPPIGVAYRAADVVNGGEIVVFTSSAMSGIDPSSGAEAWKIPSNANGAWYWSPRQGEDAAHPTVVALGPARNVLTRLDLPPTAKLP
jgi:outer membrane protein assembly factor BamB